MPSRTDVSRPLASARSPPFLARMARLPPEVMPSWLNRYLTGTHLSLSRLTAKPCCRCTVSSRFVRLARTSRSSIYYANGVKQPKTLSRSSSPERRIAYDPPLPFSKTARCCPCLAHSLRAVGDIRSKVSLSCSNRKPNAIAEFRAYP